MVVVANFARNSSCSALAASASRRTASHRISTSRRNAAARSRASPRAASTTSFSSLSSTARAVCPVTGVTIARAIAQSFRARIRDDRSIVAAIARRPRARRDAQDRATRDATRRDDRARARRAIRARRRRAPPRATFSRDDDPHRGARATSRKGRRRRAARFFGASSVRDSTSTPRSGKTRDGNRRFFLRFRARGREKRRRRDAIATATGARRWGEFRGATTPRRASADVTSRRCRGISREGRRRGDGRRSRGETRTRSRSSRRCASWGSWRTNL